jgi:hypothetical protein
MPRTTFAFVSVEVAGSRGARYVVEISGDFPFTCSCPDYEYRSGPDGTMCKHMRARSGTKAIGTTRCVKCLAWLTPADLMGRAGNAKDPAMCAGCSVPTS